jgi:anti-sigma-K factor RskA
VELSRDGADAAESSVGLGGSKVLPFEQPSRNVWASLGSFGAIAAIFVLAALIISLVVLWQQNRATRTELGRLSTELQQTKAQLDHQLAVVQLFTSPDTHMAKLAGTNVAPDAQATLAYDKDGRAMLMARGLPAAPAGKAYQLWYIAGGKAMPGKMLTTDPAGNAMLEDRIPAAALGGAVFAVTLEPEGGMPSPTGAIYLRSAA